MGIKSKSRTTKSHGRVIEESFDQGGVVEQEEASDSFGNLPRLKFSISRTVGIGNYEFERMTFWIEYSYKPDEYLECKRRAKKGVYEVMNRCVAQMKDEPVSPNEINMSGLSKIRISFGLGFTTKLPNMGSISPFESLELSIKDPDKFEQELQRVVDTISSELALEMQRIAKYLK